MVEDKEQVANGEQVSKKGAKKLAKAAKVRIFVLGTWRFVFLEPLITALISMCTESRTKSGERLHRGGQ